MGVRPGNGPGTSPWEGREGGRGVHDATTYLNMFAYNRGHEDNASIHGPHVDQVPRALADVVPGLLDITQFEDGVRGDSGRSDVMS